VKKKIYKEKGIRYIAWQLDIKLDNNDISSIMAIQDANKENENFSTIELIKFWGNMGHVNF